MTSSLDFYNNRTSHRITIHLLSQIIDILGKYSENYNKNLNFTRLTQKLKIPFSEIDEFVSLILHFQEIFEEIFNDYYLKKKRMNNQVYLVVENKNKDNTPRIINISASHLKLFNDIIYTFKFVKRGKGFDITKNGSKETQMRLILLIILTLLHIHVF